MDDLRKETFNGDLSLSAADRGRRLARVHLGIQHQCTILKVCCITLRLSYVVQDLAIEGVLCSIGSSMIGVVQVCRIDPAHLAADS